MTRLHLLLVGLLTVSAAYGRGIAPSVILPDTIPDYTRHNAGASGLIPLPIRNPAHSIFPDSGYLIKRSEYLRLELARSALLSLDLATVDEIITAQAQVIGECELALQRTVERTQGQTQTVRDSLAAARRLLVQAGAGVQRSGSRLGQSQLQVHDFGKLVDDARRFVWLQRVTAFGLGICAGVVLPAMIKLFR